MININQENYEDASNEIDDISCASFYLDNVLNCKHVKLTKSLKDSIHEVQYNLKVLIGGIVLDNHHNKWSSQHTALGNTIIDKPKNKE